LRKKVQGLDVICYWGHEVAFGLGDREIDRKPSVPKTERYRGDWNYGGCLGIPHSH